MTETKTLVKPSESDDGYAHLKQERDSKHIRLYLWLLDADPNAINTCKLFWAYVLFVPLLILKGIIAVAVAINDRLPKREDKPFDYEEWERKRQEKEAAGPSRMERILTKIADGLGAFWAKAQKPLTILWWIVITPVIVAAVAVIIAGAIIDPVEFLIVLGSILGGVLTVFGLILVVEFFSGGAGRRFLRFFGKLARGFHSHTCAKIDLD